jgi:hypothetical protein
MAAEKIDVQGAERLTLSVPGKQFVTIGSRLSFQVSSSADFATPVTLSAHSLPPGGHFDPATGAFNWTPGASQGGSWKVVFSASDADQHSASAEVLIQAGSGVSEIESLRNAASGSIEAVCSAGSLATLEGGWLSSGGTASDPSGQSLDLLGTKVLVNGAYAPVVSVSPTQVTFACPAVVAGATMAVAVETASGPSTLRTAVLREAAAGIFRLDGSSNGQAVATIL